MPLSDDDKKFIQDRIDFIEGFVDYDDPAVQEESKELTAAIVEKESIINNVAYHDFYRVELGTPLITTDIVDIKIEKELEKILDIISFQSYLFSNTTKTLDPTEADEVQELLEEINADLGSIAAGPIPQLVETFLNVALSEFIDQITWAALSASQRERLGQLASAWQSLQRSNNSMTPSTSGTNDSGGGFMDTVKDILDPAGIFH